MTGAWLNYLATNGYYVQPGGIDCEAFASVVGSALQKEYVRKFRALNRTVVGSQECPAWTLTGIDTHLVNYYAG